MLEKAVPVLREIYKRFPKGGADLETICDIITKVSLIDCANYTPYEVERSNPIWGSFKRYEESPGMYAGNNIGGNLTVVRVHYATHLTEDERVFVVAKELCHSFEEVQGQIDVSDAAIDDLVTAFSLFSSSLASKIPDLTSFNLELLATVIASEIVCPLPHRRSIIAAAGEDPDWETLGAQIKIPDPYCRAVCAISQMDGFERIFREYGLL